MTKVKPLYKTIIVVWSDYDPVDTELDDLARDAKEGESYCSSARSELIEDPTTDPQWDGTEFFSGGYD